MGSQVSAKTNDKEQQLKKASKMALIRSLLPIVGLVVIFLLFNVLTDFRMMGNIERKLKSCGVVVVSGPKFCGKTTTSERFAKSEVKLNTRQMIQLARMEPRKP